MPHDTPTIQAKIEEARTQEAGPRARLLVALWIGLRAAWDRLGTTVALSLTWTLLLMLVLALGRKLPPGVPFGLRLLTTGTAGLLLTPALAGAGYVAHRTLTHQETGYWEFWRGARQYGVQALRLGLVNWLVGCVLAANLWFYLRLGGIVGLTAALLCGYAALFWLLMAQYHVPLLIAQEAGIFDDAERKAKRGVWAVWRRAFFLVIGRPLYALALLTVTGVFAVFCYGLMVPLLVAWAGVLALAQTSALRALLTEIGVIVPLIVEPAVPDLKFKISS